MTDKLSQHRGILNVMIKEQTLQSVCSKGVAKPKFHAEMWMAPTTRKTAVIVKR
jgi:hypothetical protein